MNNNEINTLIVGKDRIYFSDFLLFLRRRKKIFLFGTLISVCFFGGAFFFSPQYYVSEVPLEIQQGERTQVMPEIMTIKSNLITVYNQPHLIKLFVQRFMEKLAHFSAEPNISNDATETIQYLKDELLTKEERAAQDSDRNLLAKLERYIQSEFSGKIKLDKFSKKNFGILLTVSQDAGYISYKFLLTSQKKRVAIPLYLAFATSVNDVLSIFNSEQAGFSADFSKRMSNNAMQSYDKIKDEYLKIKPIFDQEKAKILIEFFKIEREISSITKKQLSNLANISERPLLLNLSGDFKNSTSYQNTDVISKIDEIESLEFHFLIRKMGILSDAKIITDAQLKQYLDALAKIETSKGELYRKYLGTIKSYHAANNAFFKAMEQNNFVADAKNLRLPLVNDNFDYLRNLVLYKTDWDVPVLSISKFTYIALLGGFFASLLVALFIESFVYYKKTNQSSL